MTVDSSSSTYLSSDGRNPFDVDVDATLEIVEDIPVGTEIIRNGTFDTDSDWNLFAAEGSVEISGGSMNFTDSKTTGNQTYQRDNIYILDKYYEIKFTVSNFVSGNVRVSVGNNISGTATANGDYRYIVRYRAGLPRNYIYTNNTTLSLDNVSVKEIL
jgi:hypothetical protein